MAEDVSPRPHTSSEAICDAYEAIPNTVYGNRTINDPGQQGVPLLSLGENDGNPTS